MFEDENTGPKLWLNELMLTKSIAKKQYQNRNYENAAKYCERILELSDDLEVRILLSKCQQNLFQPDLANSNHLLANTESPNSLLVLENEASILLYNGNFEKSLLKYFKGGIKRIRSPIFIYGALKTTQIINNLTKLRGKKYEKQCLGNVVLKFAKHGDLDNLTDIKSILMKNNLIDKRNQSFYLGHLAQNKNYFVKVLKSSDPKCPFYVTEKKIQSDMNCVINATNIAENQLYQRRQLYIRECEIHQMDSERLLNHSSQFKIMKDAKHLQIVKYLNTIIDLIINGKIKEAEQKSVLLVNFMEKLHYNSSNKILDVIYRSFGVGQYLLLQDINKSNKDISYQRKLILFGATKNGYSIPLYESLFGPYDSNPNITKNKLLARIKKSKSVMEKIYLNFKMAKCYIQLGSDYFKIAKKKAVDCLQLANQTDSYTWIANSLIIIALIEFRLDNKQKCYNVLKEAIRIANTLHVIDVIKFLEEAKNMIFQLTAVYSSPNDKRKMEIINFMPNITMRMKAMHLFKKLDTMPVNRQICLVPGVILKHNITKCNSAQAAHKYLSISPGNQAHRLGIQEFMLHKNIELTVNINN